jgi:hypothetical protein
VAEITTPKTVGADDVMSGSRKATRRVSEQYTGGPKGAQFRHWTMLDDAQVGRQVRVGLPHTEGQRVGEEDTWMGGRGQWWGLFDRVVCLSVSTFRCNLFSCLLSCAVSTTSEETDQILRAEAGEFEALVKKAARH